MPVPITPVDRAKIVASIKNEGVSIKDVAKTYEVTEKTVRRWLRQTAKNAHTSSTEIQKLRQEVQELRSIIGKMVWQQETKRKK